jgi:hypothetical protein
MLNKHSESVSVSFPRDSNIANIRLTGQLDAMPTAETAEDNRGARRYPSRDVYPLQSCVHKKRSNSILDFRL